MSPDTPADIVEAKSPTAGDTALAPTPQALLMSRLRVMWCNVPLESDAARAMLMSIVGTPSIVADDRINTLLGIVAAIVQHPSEHTTDEGEVWTAPVTTLLTSEGDTLRWASSSVADCLAVLSMGRPAGLWAPPIMVRCVSVPTKKGFRRMTLQPAQWIGPIPPLKGGKNAK